MEPVPPAVEPTGGTGVRARPGQVGACVVETAETRFWFRAYEVIETAMAKARQGTRNDLVETFHDVNGGKTRDKIGAYVGVSGKTAATVTALAKPPTLRRHTCPIAAMTRCSS
jgi:hypothetical protein